MTSLVSTDPVEPTSEAKTVHPCETFATWIGARRTAIGATQDELAARINANGGNIVNGSVISHWETGSRRPSGQNLIAMCLALDVGLDRVMQILQAKPESSAPGSAG